MYPSSGSADVLLIAMPGISIGIPSLGLSLLKSSVSKMPYKLEILYANLLFSDLIKGNYDIWQNRFLCYPLFHEWVFVRSLFPDYKINDEEYLKELALLLCKKNGEKTTDKQVLQYIRTFRDIQTNGGVFIDTLTGLILEKNPKIVGCSSTFHQHVSSLALLKKLKNKNQNIVTVMGGANCTGEMGVATLNEFPWIDFIFSGEADETFPIFVKKIMDGENKDDVILPRGVISRDAAKSLSAKKGCALPYSYVKNLDVLSVPDFSDYYRAVRFFPWLYKTIKLWCIPLEMSRGCWWYEKKKCTFCGLNSTMNQYRMKSPQKVIDELKYLLKKSDVNLVQFTDNILSKGAFNNFIPNLIKENLKCTFFFEVKANLNRQKVKMLADAQIRIIQPGIESLHDGFLTLMQKGTTAIRNIQLLKYAEEFELKVCWNLLINIPGENKVWYEEMGSLIPLISHLTPPTEAIRLKFQRFSAYHANPEKYGLNLKPLRHYKYIYPFDDEKLKTLVYYFEDNSQFDKENEQTIIEFDKLVSEWHNEFYNEKSPSMLTMKKVNEEIVIWDTRSCRIKDDFILSGIDAEVYKKCDPAVTVNQLFNKMESKHSKSILLETLKKLISKKLLIKINGKFLNLAILQKS
jgi:ribosomal peptide maturation radical SAM protein 1